jgi:hypothetical protein
MGSTIRIAAAGKLGVPTGAQSVATNGEKRRRVHFLCSMPCETNGQVEADAQGEGLEQDEDSGRATRDITLLARDEICEPPSVSRPFAISH